MGRQKTISDEEVLRIAREVFRAHGHTASTRMIAQAAGISEAILYQRFGSKNELFFTAMHARGPDLEEMLGPEDPPDDAKAYLQVVITRMGKYFAEMIPLALHVMTHPSFDPASLARMQPGGPAALQQGLAERLASLAQRRRLAAPAPAVTARLLVSLAHDWALGTALAHTPPSQRLAALTELLDVVWEGLQVRKR